LFLLLLIFIPGDLLNISDGSGGGGGGISLEFVETGDPFEHEDEEVEEVDFLGSTEKLLYIGDLLLVLTLLLVPLFGLGYVFVTI